MQILSRCPAPILISGQLNRNDFVVQVPQQTSVLVHQCICYCYFMGRFCFLVYFELNLDLTSVSLMFVCLFRATKGCFVHICLSISSFSIDCQLSFNILPIPIVVLSYGMTKGKFFAVCVVCLLLSNSRSDCEYCLILLNCFFISERL